jgi:DNA-binding MarR family transcriptional regulator
MAPTRTGAAALTETGISAWKGFLRAHSRLMQPLDEQLRAEHGYSLGDFDVLAQLAEATNEKLRMCDLAAAIVLSPSGLSRRMDRLERDGLVTRRRGEQDARSVEARLTLEGKRLLARLRATHRDGVRKRFAERFTPEELETLDELLARLVP